MSVKQQKTRNPVWKRDRILGNPVTVPAQLRVAGIITLLILPMLACGYVGNVYQNNNAVRQAVYAYEREMRGKPDDLVIDFERNEPRIVFENQSENGGRTVWLYRAGAKEFFALRPPEKSYLYIQNIEFNADYTSATATVFRGDGSGFWGRQLTLHNNDEQWQVIQDIESAAN
jgi:hypothetical protein